MSMGVSVRPPACGCVSGEQRQPETRAHCCPWIRAISIKTPIFPFPGLPYNREQGTHLQCCGASTYSKTTVVFPKRIFKLDSSLWDDSSLWFLRFYALNLWNNTMTHSSTALHTPPPFLPFSHLQWLLQLLQPTRAVAAAARFSISWRINSGNIQSGYHFLLPTEAPAVFCLSLTQILLESRATTSTTTTWWRAGPDSRFWPDCRLWRRPDDVPVDGERRPTEPALLHSILLSDWRDWVSWCCLIRNVIRINNRMSKA